MSNMLIVLLVVYLFISIDAINKLGFKEAILDREIIGYHIFLITMFFILALI